MNFTLEELRAKALDLGWDDIGVTSASIPEKDILSYREWLAKGFHGDMAYMENQLRCAPQELLPGAQTAIIFVTYYKQPDQEFFRGKGLIASYARGKDYHKVHRKRLKSFIKWLEEKAGVESCSSTIAKGFSDSTPILEKALAVKAGLGWMGKNTLLIHRRFGTFTLLSGVLTTLDLPHTKTALDLRLPRCGTCTRCLDACPTQAFASPYQLDATRCLSYHLIESKKPFPDELRSRNPGYIFGCDICQNVCPHNARKNPSAAQEFIPEKGMGTYLTLEQIEDVIQHPEKLFGTPLQRKGALGLRDNMVRMKDEG